MTKSVQALLEDVRLLGEEQFQVVEAVRALARKTAHPLSEEVKFGGILFTSEVQFGGVFAFKQHVSLEFSHGTMIVDPAGVLEDGGKGRRHIKLRSVGEITDKNAASYIKLAVDAAKGTSITPSPSAGL